MGKTTRTYKGKKYKPSSKEQQKKRKDKKSFEPKGSGQPYGNRAAFSQTFMYPKHMKNAIKNPPPPFDEEL